MPPNVETKDVIPEARPYVPPPEDWTEEERAAFELDDEAEDPATAEGAEAPAAEKPAVTQESLDEQEEADAQEDEDADTEENADDQADADGAAAADGDDAAAADAAGSAAAEAPAAAAAADEPVAAPKPNAPLFVAEAPADAKERLADLATQAEALAAKFDDGDITGKEFASQTAALQAEVRSIERAVDKAEIAQAMAAQQANNEWTQLTTEFIYKQHPEYSKQEALHTALDEATRAVAVMPSMKNATFEQILAKSHKLVLIDHPDAFGTAAAAAAPAAKPAAAAAPAAKPAAKPKKDLPPNLAFVPAADVSDIGGDKYARLNRLQSTDPVAYEEAMFKMSESERKAYERS